MAQLNSGDHISVVEERAIPNTRNKREGSQTTIRILKDLNVLIEDLFKEQGRPNESLVRFLVRTGIGRVIIPKGTIVFNGDDGTLTHDL